MNEQVAASRPYQWKCEGACRVHGEHVRKVRVSNHRICQDWYYCDKAVACDRRNGFTVEEI